MGLLDQFFGQSWDDPKTQANMALASGLLGGNFAQGVQGYGSAMSGAKDAEMKRKFQQMQMEGMQSEIDGRSAAQAQTAQRQKLLESMFNVPSMSPGAFTPSAGMGPTMPPQMQQAGGVGNMSIDQIAKLKAMGGVDLFNEFKWAKDPLKLDQGATYQDRTTGKQTFMPKVGEGIAPDANGFYGALPGYAGAQGQIEGAKAGAIERAKAALDPLTYTPAGSTNPVMSNRASVMGGQSGAQPNGAGYFGGSRDGANAESIKVMTAELQNPQYDAPTKSAIMREIARLQQQTPALGAGGIQLQSEAEKAKLVGTANADVVRDTGKLTDTKRYGQLTATTDRAIELLKSGPTNSGVGSMVDSAANFFGKTTDGANTAAQLETLAGWMSANVPRMEGPQSDKDIANYKIMAAAVGDKTKPIAQRLAAADELKTLQEKYSELNGNAPRAAGGTPSKVATPMKGMIQGGYKFKGGNPADQSNWEKM